VDEENEVLVEFRSITEEISACETELAVVDIALKSGATLSAEQAGKFEQLSKRLADLKKRVVVNMYNRGFPQNHIAEQTGMSPARVCQIIAEHKRGS